MISATSSYNILATSCIYFELCAGFLTGKLNKLVRRGGVCWHFNAISNLRTTHGVKTLFSEGKPSNLIPDHSFPNLPVNAVKCRCVLTKFLPRTFSGVWKRDDIKLRHYRPAAQFLITKSPQFITSRQAFQHVLGGAVSSTAGLIKKAKEDLQRLRREYLRASDDQERKLIEGRIERQKELLEELGAESVTH